MICQNPKRELALKLIIRRWDFARLGIQRKFQKGGINSPRGRVTFFRVVEIWIAHIPKCWIGMRGERRTAQKKRRERADPLEVELDLSGEFYRGGYV